MAKVFIDGQHGTTGLQLYQRLLAQRDWQILQIEDRWRKDRERRLHFYRQADVVVMCLPDEEAREMARLVEDFPCRLLDASSAHRCAEGWVYGLPELEPGQERRIARARKVANPGCYASAVVLLLRPLIAKGVLPSEASLAIYGFSGYTGGGRQLIERYQRDWHDVPLALYALDFHHKHLPEMLRWSGLTKKPLFLPAVVNAAQGMLVNIAVPVGLVGMQSVAALRAVYHAYYHECEAVRVWTELPLCEGRFLQLSGWNGVDYCALAVAGDDEQLLLFALLDNLGKGASGAATQNLRLMLGKNE